MREQLKCGEKYTPAIFQEADGIMIVMQGKDKTTYKGKRRGGCGTKSIL